MASRGLGLVTAILLSSTAFACGNSGQEAQNVKASTSHLSQFRSNDGRLFVLKGAAPIAYSRSTTSIVAESDATPDWYANHFDKRVEDMTLDELAEALRPVTFLDGYEYELETPDYEAAKRVKSGLLASGGSGPGSQGKEAPEAKGYCCGPDGRSVIRNNTDWPYSTILALAVPTSSTSPSWGSSNTQCTMQLIGPSTATSVAHCFHDGTNWRALGMWGAAPDIQDDTDGDGIVEPFPSGFPGAYGCYVVYIPSAWIGSGLALQYDYAVVDFRGTCVPTPGLTASWVGWGTFSDAEITGTTAYGYGVTSYNPYPQIHGMSTAASTINVASIEVDHNADCDGGDSGRGLRQFIQNDWRSVSNHSRGPTSANKCQDRRLSSDVNAFIVANSEF